MSWGYLEDASGVQGHADRICIPPDEATLLALLAEAHTARVPITIAGGGSGVTAGRVPYGGWVVSMEKFRKLEIAPGLATAGAGVTLHDLHAAAKATGQFYPPDPTETMAFVGGTIACNSSGSRSFQYGATRRWVRGCASCSSMAACSMCAAATPLTSTCPKSLNRPPASTPAAIRSSQAWTGSISLSAPKARSG